MNQPDLLEPVVDLEYAVFDFETTGMSPAFGDRVCEIGIQVVVPEQAEQGGIRLRVREEYEQLVDPCRPISPGAREVNGITEDMVSGEPVFPDLAERVLDLMTGRVLVAHYATFDLKFLQAELERSGFEMIDAPVVDSCRLARRRFNFPSNSLENIASSLNLEQPRHRALSDVRTLRQVFEEFLTNLGEEGIQTLDDLIEAQGGPITPPSLEEAASLPPLIDRAMLRQDPVEITYVSSNGRQTRREITPVKSFRQGENDYLIAYCHLRDAQRTFRLDRIRGLSTGE